MKTIKKVANVFTGGNQVATMITSSSTNDEVAGAKAVYDNSLDVYSTTEQRVGTWIDGKPLYQKTYDIGTVASLSGGYSYVLDVPFDMLVETKIICYKADKSQFFPIPFAAGTTYIANDISIAVREAAGELQFRATKDYADGWKLIATIYYTKTTDTAS